MKKIEKERGQEQYNIYKEVRITGGNHFYYSLYLSMKKILRQKNILLVVLALFMVFIIPSDTVFADSDDNNKGNNGKESREYFVPLNKFAYQKADLRIDTIPEDALEEEGFFEGIFSSIGDGLKWAVSKIPAFGWVDDIPAFSDIVPFMVNFILDLAFTMNIALTELLISVIDFSMSLEFVETFLDKIEGSLRTVVGVNSDGKISDNSFFGTFGGIIALISIIYAIFLFFFRKSMLASIGSILQTVLIIALAVVLFTNFPKYMGGLNTLGVEASALLLGGTSNPHDLEINFSEPGEGNEIIGDGESSVIERMKDNIRIMFVDRPYLIMMFGDWDYERLGDGDAKAGRQRVENVVYASDKEAKMEALVEEGKNGNENVLHTNFHNKIAITPIYYFTNAITGIFILILMLISLFLQFWFLLISVLAPFVLIVAAIPGQLGVLWQYLRELISPIAFKVGLSFFMLMFFIFTDAFYELIKDVTAVELYGSSIGMFLFGLLTGGVGPLIVIIALFMLVRRAYKIFTSGSFIFRKTTEKLESGASKATGSIGAVAGGVLGFSVGGPVGAVQGATMGAGVGKNIPGTVLGNEESQEGMKRATVASVIGLGHMSKSGNLGSKSNISDEISETQGFNNIKDFLEERGVTGRKADKILETLEDSNIDLTDVDNDLLAETFNDNEAINKNTFASKLSARQSMRKRREGKKRLSNFIDDMDRNERMNLSPSDKEKFKKVIFDELKMDGSDINNDVLGRTLNELKSEDSPIDAKSFGNKLNITVKRDNGYRLLNDFYQDRGYSKERIANMKDSLRRENIDLSDINEVVIKHLPKTLDAENFGQDVEEAIRKSRLSDLNFN